MGLQLLLAVPQAGGIEARLGCSPSAVALQPSSDLSQPNLVPRARDPMYASAVLETRDTLDGMADSNMKAPKEETLLPARPEKQRWAL